MSSVFSPAIVIREEYGRPYRWMERPPRKPRRDKHPAGQRPSEIARRNGLVIPKRFGIVTCPGRGPKQPNYDLHRVTWRRDSPRSLAPHCGYLIKFRRGQRTATCGKCGRRIWLPGLRVVFQDDDMRVINRVISSICGWRGAGKTFVPAHLLDAWANRARVTCGSGESAREPSSAERIDSSAPVTNFCV